MSTTAKPHDLKGALTAIADALVMDLSLFGDDSIDGAVRRPMSWFGTKWEMSLEVEESIVDRKRGLMVVLVHVLGSLYTVLISDAEKGKLQLFLLDGSKCGLSSLSPARWMPDYWWREGLYKKMVNGLKASFTKGFYDKEWSPLDVDPNWMHNYLRKKREIRHEIATSDTKPSQPAS